MFEGPMLVLALMAQDAAAPPPDAASPNTADAGPTAGHPQDTETVVVTAPRLDPEDVVVCRRGPASVGSILARRICSTPREDRLRREHDQAEFGRMQDVQGRGMPVRPGEN